MEIHQTQFGRVKPISIVDEMEKSYLDYAMSVIVSRALPDVRDGLKPVHRRILYSMYRSGIHHTSAYKKCARIVGDVLGRYHPHGDMAVYMSLVRLAQDFSMRYKLIDGQGNYGSVDGDSPAAMRYTEARLAKISKDLLVDIEKNTVPWAPNFDGSMQEPTVLPTKLPNLLLMGSEGIAVGMATKIPPHNLTEVCNAILAMIKVGKSDREVALEIPDLKTLTKIPSAKTQHEATTRQQVELRNTYIDRLMALDPVQLSGKFVSDITIEQIMDHVKGPDFPTAGIIYDQKAILEAYQTGRGSILIRGKAAIVEGKKGGYQILISEIPYQVNKAKLIMKIADLVRNHKIEGIKDLNDDSDRRGMQITIELKRDAQPKVVLNKLYKYTELSTNFPMNMVALDSDGTPHLMNIRQVLQEYVVHRQLVIVRRSQYELGEARDRAHILEGLLIALGHLDDVIQTIRESADTDTARAALMKKFGLSEKQATAILEMQLKRLAALERQKIEDEYNEIQQTISTLMRLLASPEEILGTVSSETSSMIAEYGDERKTKVVKGKVGELTEEDLVPKEETVITYTHTGYVKRQSPQALRTQHRGGKGAIGITTRDEDSVKAILTASTHDSLLLFTNLGRVFKLKVHEITESSRQAKGTALVNLINLKAEERVESMLILNEQADQENFITLVTKHGMVKKTAVKQYENIRQNGIIAILLKDGDELVWGKITSGKDHLMLISQNGKSIRFSETEIKNSNRDTQGVKGVELKNDIVVGVEGLSAHGQNEDEQLLIVTANGLGKRTKLSEYPVQKRAGQGVKVAEITKRTGPVVSALKVTPVHEEVVITTTSGQLIKLPLTKQSIPILTRPTQGVILMRLRKEDQVAAVAVTVGNPEMPSEADPNTPSLL
jgi:DNA gyrase subunit A